MQEETFNPSLSIINDESNLRISSFLSVLKRKGMSPSEFSFFQVSENPNDNSTAQHLIKYGYKQTPPNGSPPTTSINRKEKTTSLAEGEKRKKKKEELSYLQRL